MTKRMRQRAAMMLQCIIERWPFHILVAVQQFPADMSLASPTHWPISRPGLPQVSMYIIKHSIMTEVVSEMRLLTIIILLKTIDVICVPLISSFFFDIISGLFVTCSLSLYQFWATCIMKKDVASLKKSLHWYLFKFGYNQPFQVEI